MLVAIDGPAAAGKSTVARAVARELGFTYLDSGAMYRCVALLALASPDADPAGLALAAQIEFVPDERDGERTLLDGRDVSDRIREEQVSQEASRIAGDPGVRSALVAKQRALIAGGDWVAEGRDIGTVVAPDAELKVFLTARAEVRAGRRAAQQGTDAERVLAEQTLRDQRDETRAHSPLAPAADAITLDTSGLSLAEVVERVAALARAIATA